MSDAGVNGGEGDRRSLIVDPSSLPESASRGQSNANAGSGLFFTYGASVRIDAATLQFGQRIGEEFERFVIERTMRMVAMIGPSSEGLSASRLRFEELRRQLNEWAGDFYRGYSESRIVVHRDGESRAAKRDPPTPKQRRPKPGPFQVGLGDQEPGVEFPIRAAFEVLVWSQPERVHQRSEKLRGVAARLLDLAPGCCEGVMYDMAVERNESQVCDLLRSDLVWPKRFSPPKWATCHRVHGEHGA